MSKEQGKTLKILLYSNGAYYYDRLVDKFMSQFGEVTAVPRLGTMHKYIRDYDVLVIPGGSDVDPRQYGEEPTDKCGTPNSAYEKQDFELLRPWIKTGKPIVGVCRGLQVLNVALGGTLWQDICDHGGGDTKSKRGHFMYTNDPDFNVVDVNSYHHQAIKKLADGLIDIGWSKADQPMMEDVVNNYIKPIEHSGETTLCPSIVEAIQHETLPYVAFQYHPEYYNCAFAITKITKVLKNYYGNYNVPKSKYMEFVNL